MYGCRPGRGRSAEDGADGFRDLKLSVVCEGEGGLRIIGEIQVRIVAAAAAAGGGGGNRGGVCCRRGVCGGSCRDRPGPARRLERGRRGRDDHRPDRPPRPNRPPARSRGPAPGATGACSSAAPRTDLISLVRPDRPDRHRQGPAFFLRDEVRTGPPSRRASLARARRA